MKIHVLAFPSFPNRTKLHLIWLSPSNKHIDVFGSDKSSLCDRPTAATFRTFTKPIDAIGVTRVTLSPGVKKKLSRQHFFGKSFPGEEHVSLVWENSRQMCVNEFSAKDFISNRNEAHYCSNVFYKIIGALKRDQIESLESFQIYWKIPRPTPERLKR